MSYTRNQIENIEAAQADFDGFIGEKNWTDAQAVIDNLGDEGYENEAVFLHKALNRAIIEAGQELTFEPIEDSEIPFITPEEDDAPLAVGVNFDRNDQYDKN